MVAAVEEATNIEMPHCGSPPDSVLTKAHMLLSAFTRGTSTLGLTALSRRSGVSKGSAHRLASEMVGLGYLARTPKGYQLGWRMYELGQLVPGPAGLRNVARPALLDLRMVCHAVVHLAVPRGAECVYLERLAGRRELAVIDAVPNHVPNYSTASGRVFLAHADAQTLARLDQVALARLEVHNHEELATKLADIRTRRYAEERSQCLRDFKSISVPVTYPGTDQVIAAVSVTVPTNRKDHQQLVHALWATSADISRGLLQRSYSAERAVAARPSQLVG